MTDSHTQENDPALIAALRALVVGRRPLHTASAVQDGRELVGACSQGIARPRGEEPPRETDENPPPPAAENPVPPEPPPPSASALQKLLWPHLQQDWSTLRTAPGFMRANLFEDWPQPLSDPASLFEQICRQERSLEILVGTGEFFAARSGGGSTSWPINLEKPDGIVCRAIVHCTLVAAERYIQQKSAATERRADHEPVWSSDDLVGCIEAAVGLGFGLCFTTGNRQPDNVLHVRHPLQEPGVAGEQGAELTAHEVQANLVREHWLSGESGAKLVSTAELLGIIRGEETQRGKDFDPDYLKLLIGKRVDKLKMPWVVSVYNEGRFEDRQRRAELLGVLRDQFDLRAFFRRQAPEMPEWAKQMQDTLKDALKPIFPTPPASGKTEDEPMPKETASVTVTNHFHAPVGSVAQANAEGAQAAGRDLVVGTTVADLLRGLAALQPLIAANTALSPAESRSLSGEIETAREVLRSDQAPTAASGARVKRCLERLKDTAGALTNGQTIIDALTPLWA